MDHANAVHIRTLSPADVPLAIRLKDTAGWNQVPADWEAYRQIEPGGCFVAEWGGRAVATATAVPYQGRFGWIGMVLVDPEARQRGIATRLVHHAIEYLESAGCRCQKLDATEAGARVYEKMGFTVEYEVQRWLGRGRGGAPARAGISGLNATHLAALERLDAAAFGASRRRLLEWYVDNPAPRFLAGDPAEPAGYVTGRPGSGAWQMGPLVAGDADTAEQLAISFLAGLPDAPVIADVPAVNSEAVRRLEQLGFTRRRVLQRMYRGENAWPGRPPLPFYLAGFEYG